MIISVASGKGGTGKTTVATSLALSLSNAQLLDCDVEEPNAHIFTKPEVTGTKPVFIPVPEVDETLCSFCGKCQEVCVYNAIAVIKDHVLVFSELCHGCGSCTYFCPFGAIKEVNREVGVVDVGTSGELHTVTGRLHVGEAMAPPVIKEVKKCIDPEKTIIIDAPPGTSCPVIAAITGSDYCILVTEPTPFGFHDLLLAVDVLREMAIPFGVVINRSDLGDGKTTDYCRIEQIPVLMEIPFSKEIAMAYSEGKPVVNAFPEYKNMFLNMYKKITQITGRDV
ncbi:MAG: ATP-binding protein [Candidatus Theseobacter exili]|nr:ATP-binding protein [Candidatus Theseobacter exili]